MVSFTSDGFVRSVNELQFGYALHALFYRSEWMAAAVGDLADEVRPTALSGGAVYDAVGGNSSLVVMTPNAPSVRLARDGPIRIRRDRRMIPHGERRRWRSDAMAVLDERDRQAGRAPGRPLASKYRRRE